MPATALQIERQVVRRDNLAIRLPKFPPGVFKALRERRITPEQAEDAVERWWQMVQIALNQIRLAQGGGVTEVSTGLTLDQDILDALQGSSGTPSNSNRYVTQEDVNQQIQDVVNQIPAAAPSVSGVYVGVGDPNGSVSAARGSIYNEFSVGYAMFLRQWIKTTLAGNTGWV